MKFVILSDIHANMAALTAALTKVREIGFDRLIILGDLFTYGVEPRAVFEQVAELQSRDGALLLLGNHDELYLDPGGRARSYRERMPDWILESVEWTEREIEGLDLSRLDWRRCYIESGVFFAHANPFPFPDWSYVNGEAEHLDAAAALEERACRFGVFGHTHRQKLVRVRNGSSDSIETPALVSVAGNAIYVANAGSVGQPRNAERRSYLLELDVRDEKVHVRFVPIQYDVDRTTTMIRDTGLSAGTSEKLVAFLS